MLCYVMLCYVMLCYVMLCYVMLCYVMLCYDLKMERWIVTLQRCRHVQESGVDRGFNEV